MIALDRACAVPEPQGSVFGVASGVASGSVHQNLSQNNDGACNLTWSNPGQNLLGTFVPLLLAPNARILCTHVRMLLL
jgi:hypothetical protein